mgnify:CR=1 FL=1
MPELDYDLNTLLSDVVSRGASDLHLIPGIPPIARVGGTLGSLPYQPVDAEGIMKLVDAYMSEARKKVFDVERRLNFSESLPNLGRFRFNMYQAFGGAGAVIRVIPAKTYPLTALGLPPVVGNLAYKRSGIIFVTGATGSGKSTTMAAMLEWINQTGRPGKIITIEDPIESLFKPCKSVFVQREVGTDTDSFDIGILDSLRQDPDVLCIGEMRDIKSMRAAMLAAETGHLVLTTLHTRDASSTAQRIVNVFPAGEQEGVRHQLSNTLEAVISQELLPRIDGRGVAIAVEILISTPAVRQLIRENKLEAINDAIQSGLQTGMISKDASIKNLYLKKIISREVALEHMRNPDMLGK